MSDHLMVNVPVLFKFLSGCNIVNCLTSLLESKNPFKSACQNLILNCIHVSGKVISNNFYLKLNILNTGLHLKNKWFPEWRWLVSKPFSYVRFNVRKKYQLATVIFNYWSYPCSRLEVNADWLFPSVHQTKEALICYCESFQMFLWRLHWTVWIWWNSLKW